ncbi:MAG: LysM peptidoglycan-binding domain-containing protein [Patescibacteria group bacterium]
MFFRKKNFELSDRLRLGVGRNFPKNKILKITGIVCLVLAFGLTINSIYLVSKDTTPKGEVLGTVDLKNSEPEFIEYKIEKGDTLFNLSQKYNISWVTLANLNNLKSPFTLKPGQTIKIPKQ